MRISVLVIAHNEEKYITRCLESVLNQTMKADEVLLLVHNSTDRTKEIAEQYSIKIISFNSTPEIAYARIEGMNHVFGDMVMCIDGDSYAKENWIEVMSTTLNRNNVLVGSFVKMKGSLFSSFTNIYHKYLCSTKGKKASVWIWGPSFAFWNRDKEKIQNIYKKSIELSQKLRLSRNPEDYWLALFMKEEGNIEVTNETYVVNNIKEVSTLEAIKRSVENLNNGLKINTFFRSYLLGQK